VAPTLRRAVGQIEQAAPVHFPYKQETSMVAVTESLHHTDFDFDISGIHNKPHYYKKRFFSTKTRFF